MRVRLNTDRAGDGFYQAAGEIVDLPEREAYRMIESGQAEPVEPESAAMATAETTTLDSPRFKGKR